MFAPNKRQMSFGNNANSKGPSTDPCGTPLFVGRNTDLVDCGSKSRLGSRRKIRLKSAKIVQREAKTSQLLQ